MKLLPFCLIFTLAMSFCVRENQDYYNKIKLDVSQMNNEELEESKKMISSCSDYDVSCREYFMEADKLEVTGIDRDQEGNNDRFTVKIFNNTNNTVFLPPFMVEISPEPPIYPNRKDCLSILVREAEYIGLYPWAKNNPRYIKTPENGFYLTKISPGNQHNYSFDVENSNAQKICIDVRFIENYQINENGVRISQHNKYSATFPSEDKNKVDK